MSPPRQSPPARLRLAPIPRSDDSPRLAAPAIRVILADDHALMRRNLRLLLDREDGVQVIAEAEDLETVTRHVHGHLPHVLVLDLGMPSGSSLATIRRLREQVPGTEIVVLTMDKSPASAQRALDAGASGFVLKELADAELGPAVRSAARSEEYISPGVAAQLASLRRAVAGDALTVREVEILRLTALGHTSAEIARLLHISRRTIETHRAHIHRKLGLATRAELIRYALRRGLLRA
ncbi:MAG: response regulator transcription factor [Actinomycetota bacterium]|nr:response regulator transcription factor [Actinomycetota bacterium]